eukprot:3355062-Pyramimonas_sp.AAC.1
MDRPKGIRPPYTAYPDRPGPDRPRPRAGGTSAPRRAHPAPRPCQARPVPAHAGGAAPAGADRPAA